MKKIIYDDSGSDTGTVLREAVELPTVEIYKTQLDKESSEQPGLTLTLTLLRTGDLDLKSCKGSFQPK